MCIDIESKVHGIISNRSVITMEQELDEGNKIIHIKCTEEEKEKIISELSQYLYDYQFNFLITDGEDKNQ